MHTNVQPPSRWPAAVQWAAEALAGAALGLILAICVGFAGARLFAGASSGWGDLIAAVLGALIGYSVGTSIGVYLAGRRLGRRGSYWAALAGSLLGVALVLLAAEPLRLNRGAALLQATLATVAPMLSALLFTLGDSRKRSGPSE